MSKIFDLLRAAADTRLKTFVGSPCVIPNSRQCWNGVKKTETGISKYVIVQAHMESNNTAVMTIKNIRTGETFTGVRSWMLFALNGKCTIPNRFFGKTTTFTNHYQQGMERNKVIADWVHRRKGIKRAIVLDGSQGNTGRALLQKNSLIEIHQVNRDPATLLLLGSMGFQNLYHVSSLLRQVPGLSPYERNNVWSVFECLLVTKSARLSQAARELVKNIRNTAYVFDTYSDFRHQHVLDALCEAGAPVVEITYNTRGSRVHPRVPDSHKIVFSGGRQQMNWIIMVSKDEPQAPRKRKRTEFVTPKKQSRSNMYGKEILVPGYYWNGVSKSERQKKYRCRLGKSHQSPKHGRLFEMYCYADKKMYRINEKTARKFLC